MIFGVPEDIEQKTHTMQDLIRVAVTCIAIGFSLGIVGWYFVYGDTSKLNLEWTYLDTNNRLHTYVKPAGFMSWVEVDQHSGVKKIEDQ